MSIRAAEVINCLTPKSYLELGVYDNTTFNAVKCANKMGVDTNGNGTFTGTTDEFFAQNHRCWDTVFIDACHDIDFVVRDWNNAIQVADRILIHDCIPPTKKHCAKEYCSDSYLLLNHFNECGLEHCTLNEDCGLTVVKRKHFMHVCIEDIAPVTYEAFMERVKTVNLQEFIDYARG